jgi:hypothetical protein
MNLLHLDADALRDVLVPALDELVTAGRTNSYVEQVLSDLIRARRLKLAGVRCDDVKWFEIDSEEDLRVTESIFAHLGAAAGKDVSSDMTRGELGHAAISR